jgi:hypothetical protein
MKKVKTGNDLFEGVDSIVIINKTIKIVLTAVVIIILIFFAAFA